MNKDISASILDAIAFAIGLASLAILGMKLFAAAREDVTVLLVLLIPLFVGIPLLISWRRDVAQDPSVVVASILATCTGLLVYGYLVQSGTDTERHIQSWSDLFNGNNAQRYEHLVITFLVPFVFYRSWNFSRNTHQQFRNSVLPTEADLLKPPPSSGKPQPPPSRALPPRRGPAVASPPLPRKLGRRPDV